MLRTYAQALITSLQEATSSDIKLRKFSFDRLEDVIVTKSRFTGQVYGLTCSLLNEDTSIDVLCREILINNEWVVEIEQSRLTHLIDDLSFAVVFDDVDLIDWERIIDFYRH